MGPYIVPSLCQETQRQIPVLGIKGLEKVDSHTLSVSYSQSGVSQDFISARLIL